MPEESLEQKLRKLAQIAEQSNDPALKKEFNQLANEVRAELKKPKKEPSYFSRKSNVPEELYQMVETQDISVVVEGDTRLQKDMYRTFADYDLSREGIFGRKWVFYRDINQNRHLMLLKEKLREAAKEAARKHKYDAVLVDEKDIKIDGATSRGKTFLHQDKMRYSASVLATFYRLKENIKPK